jgi:radical SAM protein (TIGR01212 family)
MTSTEIPYRSFASYLRERFGGPVRKVPLDAGFSCPNRDGTVGTEGCLFCDAEGGTGRKLNPGTVREQLEGAGRCLPSQRTRARDGVGGPGTRFIAYFQSFSNTYAPVDRLRELYEAALDHRQVVGLAVGTRPDCLPPETLALLEALAARTWVSVELGVQSLHDPTLAAIGRGHDAACSLAAITACRSRGLFVCAHLILGLPGEGPEHWRKTARQLARTGIDAVKLHMLYVVDGTALGRAWTEGRIPTLTLEEYAGGAADVLERLPPETVVERLVSDPPTGRTLAPDWLGDKDAVLAAVRAEMKRRGSRQGARFEG